MKAQGIRLVPIIDAAVKIEDGYDVYEEGVKNGYFCTNQDGTPFVAGVWPGRVHFPDMLNPEAVLGLAVNIRFCWIRESRLLE